MSASKRPAMGQIFGQTPIKASMLALEPRIMFDGAGLATAIEAGHGTDAVHSEASTTPEMPVFHPVPAASPLKEIVFVDTRVPDYQSIVSAIGANVEVVLLDTGSDGVSQIAEALNGRSGIDAIHLVSHGDDGVLLLGNGNLHAGNLDRYAAALGDIGSALTAEGDIHLWGCNVGAGDTGAAFLAALSSATGADIAASANDTGAGGDWTLEIVTGEVATSAALDSAALSDYGYSLATFSVDTIGELQSALATAANNGQADTITLTGDIVATGSGDFTNGYIAYIDLAEVYGLTIVGGGYSLDANYYGQVLYVSAGDTVSIENLTIRDGVTSGNGGDSGNAGQSALGGGIHNLGDLTLTGVTVTGNAAAGGGGGGGIGAYLGSYAGAGGGGGSLGGVGGGDGGDAVGGIESYLGTAGTGGTGGQGGAYSAELGGGGGTTSGGLAGGTGTIHEHMLAGGGGTASNGTISIGGGGGGAAYANNGLAGGNAAGGIYNAGTLTIIGSTISGNIAAGGGGGAGGNVTYSDGLDGTGGDGGIAVGAIWNTGTLRLDNASNSSFSSNVGSGGGGGTGNAGNGTAGASIADIYNDGGTVDTSYNPNPAPILDANGAGGGTTNSVTFSEGGGAIRIVTSDATLTDDDDITGMTLELSATPNGSSEAIAYSAALNGGSSLASLGLTGSYDAATGTYTLLGTAPAATYQAVLRAMVYENTSDAPVTSARTVTISAADAEGAAGQTTATIGITAVNDAPTASNLTQSKAVTEGGSTVALDDIVVTDADGSDTITATLTLSDPAAGSLSIGTFGSATSTYDAGTGVWTVIGSVTDVNAALAAVALTPSADNDQSFTITTRIRDAAGSGPVDGAITVTVTPVNDAPVVTAPASIVVTEDVGSVLTGISFSDIDAGTGDVTVTLSVPSGSLSAVSGGDVTVGGTTSALTLTGTIADINAFIAASSLSFTPAANATADVALSISIDDNGNSGPGGNQIASAVVTLTVEAVNDAPVVIAPASIFVTEDVASVLTGISFSDIDVGSGDFTVTLSVPSGSLSATSGGGVAVGGTSSDLTLTGTIADINAFIAASGVTFTTAPNATANVTLTVTADDGGNTGSGGALQDSATVTLDVMPVNSAPTITAPASINVMEDANVALNSISFADPDAGSDPVSVTYEVSSGSLTATSGSGVTVGGTSSTLTLTGTIADINAFIAANNVIFRTATNSVADITLTVSIDDGGNNGSGGNQTSSESVTLNVTAVNDAPVNVIPDAQSVKQDGGLVFSQANGNAISVSDVDAGDGEIQVELTATFGTLTLSTTSGLSFIFGSGAGDITMRFSGTMADINAALDGLTFNPQAGYTGSAVVSIFTNDTGRTGGGGAQSDFDQIAITVSPLNPEITNVDATSANGGYRLGDVITIAVTFDQIVTVDTTGGIPSLLLETGAVDSSATYISGSGSDTLIFQYAVQEGDLAPDLDYHSTGALSLNGATIIGNGLTADLTLPATGGANSIAGQANIAVDGVIPEVTSVGLPADDTYGLGENLDFTVNFDEAVTVFTGGGTPRIAITLDTGGTVYADYVGGSGSSALVFRLTVSGGQLDTNGITVATSIDANGGTLRDAMGNDAGLALNSGATTGVKIDAIAPTATIVLDDTALGVGESTTVTITFGEAVTGLIPGSVNVENGTLGPISSSDGGVTWTAIFTPNSGVEDATNLISVDMSSVQDAAGNQGTGLAHSTNYVVDTIRPDATITISDTALTAGETATVTITFTEAVSGLSAADFVVPNGTLSGFASADGGVTWTATLSPTIGRSEPANVIAFDLAGIADMVGNAGTGIVQSPSYAVDSVIAAPPPPGPPEPPPGPPPFVPSDPPPAAPPTPPVMSYGPVPPPLTTVVSGSPGFSFLSAPAGASSPIMDFQSQVMSLSIPSGAALQPGEAFSIGIIGDAENMGDLTFELRAADGTELPEWVNFDAASGTISGQVPEGFTGVVRVQIIITDEEGRTIIRVIELSSSGTAVNDNQAFMREPPLPEAGGREGLDGQLALQAGISLEQAASLLRGLAAAGGGQA